MPLLVDDARGHAQPSPMPSAGFAPLPALAFAHLGAYELVAGVLITLGLFTRAAAFVASGAMAVAYWYAHAPQNSFPVNNDGDAAILYCFIFLYFVFTGPSPLSIDALRGGTKR
jgi:putative oxidoreductase